MPATIEGTTDDNRVVRALGWFSIAVPVVFTALFAACLPTIVAGETIRLSYPWVPSLSIELSFYIDGLGLIFALPISAIGVLIMLYSGGYLAGHPHLGRFYIYMLLFMVGMLGLVLADNLITLFVFWEITTVTSYLLIGFDSDSAKARRNALQALLVTGAGGLALLAGLIILGLSVGSFELSEIRATGNLVRDHAYYMPILILVLIGAFTKSAQVPFHFWLPNAMAAPTPVSAYLHSATMVKAGIYLLARMNPILGATDVWIWTLTILGAVTAVVASVLALRQTDLKLALAYTTLMALGTLTMFLGSDDTVAIAAAMTFFLVHSSYKASLFLVVGIIDHGTGTRDVALLRGLAKSMPVVAVAAALASLSMAGFPPFLGFISKELKYEGALAIATEPMFVVGATVLANALMVAVAGIVGLRPFFGTPLETPKAPHAPPFRLWIGPLLLAALGLTFGITPALIADNFVQPAVTSILGRPESVKLLLWHGVNVPLMLSIVTFLLGLAIFFYHQKLRAALARMGAALPTTADGIWDAIVAGTVAMARLQTRVLQSGSLRRYLFVIFTAFILLVGIPLFATDALRFPSAMPELLIKEWIVVVLISAGACMAVVAYSRLAIICALGVVGVGVALIFLMFGAPDVAITQLLVETLVVILVALVLLHLPRLGRAAANRLRPFDAIISIAVGAVVALVLLSVVDGPIDRSISTYFEENSVPAAFGRNIVNVILVDFRALDTFGEIGVVAVAAIAAYALIRGTGRSSALVNSMILQAGTRILFSLILLFSLYMLLRGHNEPGGGFIGGLIAAIGFALYSVSHGTEVARRALRIDPRVIAMVGLGLALLAGLIAAAFGDPLFTGQWWHVAAEGDDKGVPLSTVLLFDVGVYLVVVGSVLTLVLTLEEEA
ncbi:MAG: putative monovalent cation/H+ antiporter subunit A [Pseudomonadota bacterium]